MSATSHVHDPQALYRHWEDEQWNPWSTLGASSDEIRRFALDGLTRRLAIIGVPLGTI